MKSFYTYFLVIIITVPLISKVGVYLDWKWHQDSIIKELCINKSKPALKCNGKCQLKKRLDTHPNENDIPVQEKIKEIRLQPMIFCEINNIFNDSHFDIPQNSNNYSFGIFVGVLLVKNIFDPPDTAISIS